MNDNLSSVHIEYMKIYVENSLLGAELCVCQSGIRNLNFEEHQRLTRFYNFIIYSVPYRVMIDCFKLKYES